MPDQDHGNGHRDAVTIHIDKKEFKLSESAMTGAQLRALPTPPIGPDRDLYEEVPGEEDILIESATVVTLRDGMHFFTAPHSINPGR